MATIRGALAEHLGTMDAVPNQMCAKGTQCVGGASLDYTVCADPHSPETLPGYPNCTSNPENFNMSLRCRNHRGWEQPPSHDDPSCPSHVPPFHQ